MKNNKLIWIPRLIGLSVVIAHLLPEPIYLKAALKTWGGIVTTKPITALCLILASLAPQAVTSNPTRRSFEVGLFLILTVVVGFIGLMPNSLPDLQKSGYNIPSWGTALCFFVIAYGCFNNSALRICGRVVMSLCLLALVGHVFNIPEFYYYLESFSTAMARPTLVALWFLGFLISKK